VVRIVVCIVVCIDVRSNLLGQLYGCLVCSNAAHKILASATTHVC
jgi:hypothetical protein